MSYKETPEQSEIISFSGQRLVVKAYAGTGKTTTLVKFALANPTSRILYLAYNRAIRDEAQLKFPSNVECKTSHQLAYANFGYRYAHKLRGNIKLTDICKIINTNSWTLTRDVLDTLNNYLNSSDKTILYDHFTKFNSEAVLTLAQEQYSIKVIEAVELVWDKMTDINDYFPATHDMYLKQYQLSSPALSKRYHIILFDEAQDANPVISDIVLQQNCRVILVGDDHQMIYRFRGADNSLKHPALTDATKRYLTKSFRFGPNIALVANTLLELKGETIPVIGKGMKDSVLFSLPSDLRHKAVVHRTVMGVLETAIFATFNNQKIFWVGGIESYQVNHLLDLYWLFINQPQNIKDKNGLQEYENFSEYYDVAMTTKDAEMCRAINILKRFDDIPTIVELLYKNSVTIEKEANLTVSTAHKSKGLEWQHVQLYSDFPDIFSPELKEPFRQDEINLLYVSVTRAIKQLAINTTIQNVIEYITKKRNSEKLITES